MQFPSRFNHQGRSAALFFIVLGLLSGASANWQYKSRPDLSPPKFNITIPPSSAVSPGYIFVAPYTLFPVQKTEPYAPLQPAPYIFASTGDLVWSGLGYFSGLPGNFQPGKYDGQDVLFGFEGNWAGRPGNTHGHVKILNQHYDTIKEVRSGNNRILDTHEFNILDGKTALVQSNHPVPYDLSRYGMKRESQWIMVDTFQEVDLNSGKLLFEWNSIDHVNLNESLNRLSSFTVGTGHNSSDPVDYFHLNSIDRGFDGNYLISARHTSTIYKINGTTGEIIWRLGGKHSNFTLGEGAEFGLQHHARVVSESDDSTTISLFDNSDPKVHGKEKKDGKQSRGIILSMNTTSWEANLVQGFSAPDNIFASTQGNTQVLDNGNVFVNWGSAGAISEFLPNGSVIFHAYLDSGELFEKGDVENYRGFKFNWTGIPTEKPAVVALKHGESTMVYVSWNGDTETRTWRFYGNDEEGENTFLGEEKRTGFETGFYVTRGERWQGFVAQAVGGDGKILISSGVAKAQEYIYQYVPGRDDFVLEEMKQKVLGTDDDGRQVEWFEELGRAQPVKDGKK